MELKDTIKMMDNADYKERFKAEYYQTKIRYDKLVAMCDKWDKDELDFTPTCPRTIFYMQLDAMKTYLNILQFRAQLENIKL